MSLTAIQTRTTKTATFNGASVDISGVTGDWLMRLRIFSLTAGKRVRLAFYDSVDAFTNKLPLAVRSYKGEIVANAPVQIAIKKRDIPSARFGVASAVLRLEVTEIDAATTVDYESYLET